MTTLVRYICPLFGNLYDNLNKTQHISLKSSIRLFKDDVNVEIRLWNLEKYSEVAILTQTRFVSPQIPIPLKLNHPLAKNIYEFALTHNGVVDKDILNNLLLEKILNLDNYSDTELIFKLIEQYFKGPNEYKNYSQLEIWKHTIKKN